MAVNFPDSPSNGDEFTTNGITFVYNSTDGRWDATGVSSTATTSDTAPTNPTAGDLWFDSSTAVLYIYYNDGSSSQWIGVSQIGTTDVDSGAISVVSDTAPTSATSGKMWFDSSDGSLYVYYNDGSSSQWISVSGPAGAAGADGADGADGEDGSSVTSYANTSVFPSSGNSVGDFAFATDTKAVYIWDGSEWDRISAGADESPVITTEPPTTHTLLPSGNTTSVTMTAQDPEGFDITYGIAYNTTDGSLPDQLGAATSINQSTGEFTFTPTSNTSNGGSFKARLSASDGVKATTRLVDCSLAFNPTIQYLVVAGGGAGGNWVGGGGGGGGVLTDTAYEAALDTTFNIIVGEGGAGAASNSPCSGAAGNNGANSVFGSFTAIGGGGGGSYNGIDANDGGSGGGARHSSYGGTDSTAGSGTAGQGYDGKARSDGSNGGGGGGGAGSVGKTDGRGGDGISSSITGTSVLYAGGGNGYGQQTVSSGGGLAGGGKGAVDASNPGSAGTDGLGGGGGGGGGCSSSAHQGGASFGGGRGTVIIRIASTYNVTTTGSPTITTVGTDKVYEWSANGTVSFST